MPDPFQEWLAKADIEILECRKNGHQWSGSNDKRTHYRKWRSGDVEQEQVCLRGCNVRRHQTAPRGDFSDASPWAYDYSGSPRYQFKDKVNRTPGRHVTREHKVEIAQTLFDLVPAERIEMMD